MILAIPYNPNLPGGYDRITSSILRNGKHPNHTLFVVALPQHEDGAFALAMKLKDHFGRHFAITVPSPRHPETKIQASNRTFLAALDALKTYVPSENENAEPVLLYFDPTWRPTKARWLDELQADYHLAGTPVIYGNFNAQGDNAKIEGPVVISRRFFGKTILVDFIPHDTHWRNFLAWEMIKNGLQAEAFGKVLPAYIRP